jgi:hypothetical protein
MPETTEGKEGPIMLVVQAGKDYRKRPGSSFRIASLASYDKATSVVPQRAARRTCI